MPNALLSMALPTGKWNSRLHLGVLGPFWRVRKAKAYVLKGFLERGDQRI